MVAFCIVLIIVSLLLLYPLLQDGHFDSLSCLGVVGIFASVFFAILTLIAKLNQ